MPPTKSHGRAPPPEMGAIHKALFNEKSGGRGSAGNGSGRRRQDDRGGSRGSKPMFTVTMAKKDGSRY